MYSDDNYNFHFWLSSSNIFQDFSSSAFLRSEEVLLAGDLAHAALKFRQALTDFLLKPVQAVHNSTL